MHHRRNTTGLDEIVWDESRREYPRTVSRYRSEARCSSRSSIASSSSSSSSSSTVSSGGGLDTARASLGSGGSSESLSFFEGRSSCSGFGVIDLLDMAVSGRMFVYTDVSNRRPNMAGSSVTRTRISLALLSARAPSRHNSALLLSRRSHSAANPNPKQGHQLDPGLQKLLQETDLSLLRSQRGKNPAQANQQPTLDFESSSSKETQIVFEEDDFGDEDLGNDPNAWHNRTEKRSREAVLGSRHIGISMLPLELENAIVSLVNGSSSFYSRIRVASTTLTLGYI